MSVSKLYEEENKYFGIMKRAVGSALTKQHSHNPRGEVFIVYDMISNRTFQLQGNSRKGFGRCRLSFFCGEGQIDSVYSVTNSCRTLVVTSRTNQQDFFYRLGNRIIYAKHNSLSSKWLHKVYHFPHPILGYAYCIAYIVNSKRIHSVLCVNYARR